MRCIGKRWPQRLAAAATVAALLAYVLFCTNVHYDLGDDVLLARSFGGMVGGVFESFNYITHTFLGWLMHSLSLLWPGVAWFSVAQVAVLWISAYAAVLSAMRAAQRLMLPAWCGWLAAVAYLLGLAAEGLTSVTYTLTAAAVGGAAVWRLVAVDWQAGRKAAVRGALGSGALLYAAYLLRAQAFLPSLCLWVSALVALGLMKKAPWRALGAGAAAVAVLFGASAGVRVVQLSAPERASYLAWQAARTQAIDYGGLAAAEAEALEAAGLTPEMAELALSGCLLDASVTTEALAALEPPEEAHTLQETLETLRVLFRRSRGAYWACAALAGLCALAALLALAGPRGSRLWPFLASAGVGLAAAAMLLYLAWMGRLPARAAMTVLLPAVALALWLVLHGAAGLWTSGSGPRRAAAVAAVLVGAAMLAPCARAAYHSTYNPDPAQGESACTRLERYALAHGDRLFITDLSLGDDRSLFPDWSAGKPANLLLAWGGWNNHSEGYCAAFARFGYAHDGFRIADFADSPLRLVTGAGAQPSDAFMACLNRQLGRPVTAVLEAEEGGFAVYAFTTETADKGDGNP